MKHFLKWLKENYYKNCNKKWVQIGHNIEFPKEYSYSELKEIYADRS